MADEELVPTPTGTTEDQPVETQPQADPTPAPDVEPVVDDLPGTTGDPVSEKAKLAITRYQNLIENLKARGIDPDEIKEMKQPAGSIADALPANMFDQQQPAPIPAEGEGEGEQTPDYSIIDPVTLKQTLREISTEIRTEENFVAEWKTQQGKFDDWAEKNKVSLPEIKKAVDIQLDEIGWGKTPAGFMGSVKRILRENGVKEAKQKTKQDMETTAANKAEALAGVTQPAAGAPPNPAAKPGETQEQKAADNIAPNDEYEYHGTS